VPPTASGYGPFNSPQNDADEGSLAVLSGLPEPVSTAVLMPDCVAPQSNRSWYTQMHLRRSVVGGAASGLGYHLSPGRRSATACVPARRSTCRTLW